MDELDPFEDEGPASSEPIEEGAPTWMVTFGDMMSLLLTFFILLFSMSELKMDRFLLASQSLREVMGGTAVEDVADPLGLMPDPVDPDLKLQNPGAGEQVSTTAPCVPDSSAGTEAVDSGLDRFVEAYMLTLAERLQAFVDEQQLAPEVRVERAGDGVYLRMESATLFESGDAVIRPPAVSVLAALAAITRDLEVGVTVAGHADDRPIRSAGFASNWELSAARAAGVARYLVSHGQDPARTRVEAFGEHRPIAGNDTPEGRAENRRVDIFFARADVVRAARRIIGLPQPGAAAEGSSVTEADAVP